METIELERLAALKEYEIMDSLPEEDYDNLTQLAAQICGTSISLISLLDDSRQWFKSAHGIDVRETPREQAFCAHTIQNPNELLVVPDSRTDSRFAQNPLVIGPPNIVFYAGMPLVDERGYALGSLCVIDSKQLELSEGQAAALRILAKQVTQLMQLKKKNKALTKLVALLEEQNAELLTELNK